MQCCMHRPTPTASNFMPVLALTNFRMNRLEYTDSSLRENESFLIRENNVRLYDGDQKTRYEGGEIIITTHRLIWCPIVTFNSGDIVLSLPLYLVTSVGEESPGTFSFSRSRKVVLQLSEPSTDRNEGVQLTSAYNYMKLSFREGYSSDVCGIINDCILKRKWESVSTGESSVSKVTPVKLRYGIVGIERSLNKKQKETDESISEAFQDLDKLMAMAKEMVRLSSNISTKIREKQGDITEDETIRFKSYLLSLGIDDPVTRDAYKTNNQYFKDLAREISDALEITVSEIGGMMALSDVYCRINRARGLELVSPDDLLNACKVMESIQLPLKLHQFDSGVKVLQLRALSAEAVSIATAELLDEEGPMTAEELAQHLNVSVLLARERLLTAEGEGKCCRDDSMAGLRFYPNLFLTKDD